MELGPVLRAKTAVTNVLDPAVHGLEVAKRPPMPLDRDAF